MKGQLIISDVILSMSILLIIIYYVFMHVQNDYLISDYSYQTLSRICKTHLYSGIASSLIDRIALTNDTIQKNILAKDFILSLPEYINGSLIIQNESDSFSYNLNTSDTLKPGEMRISTTSILYADNSTDKFVGKVTLTCWYKKG
ncbi:MAG: hypothetical protein QW076_01370 [Candidatus Anstonellales archaeon]